MASRQVWGFHEVLTSKHLKAVCPFLRLCGCARKFNTHWSTISLFKVETSAILPVPEKSKWFDLCSHSKFFDCGETPVEESFRRETFFSRFHWRLRQLKLTKLSSGCWLHRQQATKTRQMIESRKEKSFSQNSKLSLTKILCAILPSMSEMLQVAQSDLREVNFCNFVEMFSAKPLKGGCNSAPCNFVG